MRNNIGIHKVVLAKGIIKVMVEKHLVGKGG
jgi:hypothetical protein